MTSVFLREQKRYTQEELSKILDLSETNTVRILKRLKEYGVLKAVKLNEEQKQLTDLLEEDIEVADVEVYENEYLYVFTFVGVIIVEGMVLKCYPKYIKKSTEPKVELKQVLQVLTKYNSKEQIIRMYNESVDSTAFNMLAVMLFLLQDYFDNGSYTNTHDIIEVNGSGDILWDKTINETFTLLNNNRPYYPELLTSKRKNDEFDFFKRLHECIISKCSKELIKSDLLELFDMVEVDISDEELDDFGEIEYILERISRELSVQFNTRKQLLLKTLYAYVANSNVLDNIDCFSMFGTNSFNLVWESVCAEVMDNQLNKTLGALKLPTILSEKYKVHSHKTLLEIIEKPSWYADSSKLLGNGKTLIPDSVSIVEYKNEFQFIIFDAKYYNSTLQEGKPVRGQPGIESITKQYLYQLAYKDFLGEHNISVVHNCFLMPTENENVIDKGYVSLEMLNGLGLEKIKVRFLPAEKMYAHYLKNQKFDFMLLLL